MSTAISISDVRKQYGSLQALKGINLDIERGEFFGLLGPNGAGKSTLINIIAGLARADTGYIKILGHDVVSDYRNSRKHVGIVPQELVFDAFFCVREMLRIQSGYFGLGKENDDWIDELLCSLKLQDKAETNMRALSGGMKRRVLIAQALVHKPEVIVLDEPTAGVDVELRKLLWTFIRKLHADGHTIVLTTHYLEEAESLCDRIAILNHGVVVALDSKQSLLNSEIGKTYVAGITAAKDIEKLPSLLQNKVKVIDGNYVELELHKDRDSIVDILDSMRNEGIDVIDLKTERADLEDIFLALTNRGEHES